MIAFPRPFDRRPLSPEAACPAGPACSDGLARQGRAPTPWDPGAWSPASRALRRDPGREAGFRSIPFHPTPWRETNATNETHPETRPGSLVLGARKWPWDRKRGQHAFRQPGARYPCQGAARDILLPPSEVGSHFRSRRNDADRRGGSA